MSRSFRAGRSVPVERCMQLLVLVFDLEQVLRALGPNDTDADASHVDLAVIPLHDVICSLGLP